MARSGETTVALKQVENFAQVTRNLCVLFITNVLIVTFLLRFSGFSNAVPHGFYSVTKQEII